MCFCIPDDGSMSGQAQLKFHMPVPVNVVISLSSEFVVIAGYRKSGDCAADFLFVRIKVNVFCFHIVTRAL